MNWSLKTRKETNSGDPLGWFERKQSKQHDENRVGAPSSHSTLCKDPGNNDTVVKTDILTRALFNALKKC